MIPRGHQRPFPVAGTTADTDHTFTFAGRIGDPKSLVNPKSEDKAVNITTGNLSEPGLPIEHSGPFAVLRATYQPHTQRI